MNNKNECKNQGHRDFSAGKGAFQDADNLSSSSETHVIEWKNWFPQVILCPHTMACTHRCTHINTHTEWINIKLKFFL